MPLLARALRQQLFEPGAHVFQARAGYDRHLVTPRPARLADRHPKLHARIGIGRRTRRARPYHQVRRLQERLQIQSHGRGRDHAEV